MAEATMCPLLLVLDPNLQPDEIDKKQMRLIREHFDACTKGQIKIKVSAHLLNFALNSYPWNQINNPAWKQYLFLWQASIITPLLNKTDIVSHDIDQTKTDTMQNVYRLWYEWLLHWEAGPCIKGKFLKGIGTKIDCKNDENSLKSACTKFILASSGNDWRVVKYPWLLKYSLLLPTDGAFPFIPCDGWDTETPAPRGPKKNGYLDKFGNEWAWCTKHKDHWDVQLPRSDKYRRITPEGKEI